MIPHFFQDFPGRQINLPACAEGPGDDLHGRDVIIYLPWLGLVAKQLEFNREAILIGFETGVDPVGKGAE